MVKIGINGFGRIGRLVLRVCMEKFLNKCTIAPPVNVVAINDPNMTAAQMGYLFKYDSTHGIYPGEITTMGNCLIIDGQRVECTSENLPEKIQWSKNCTEYVVEASGKFTICPDASKHQAKRVIITADSEDAPIFIMGVNHDCYSNDMKIVAGGSCTTNALAPLLKVVHENFEIERCVAFSVHAVMNCQIMVDAQRKNWRLGRGGLQNIIPLPTTANDAIQKVYPELKGKVAVGMVRVPIPDVSLLTLTAELGKEAPIERIKCKLKSAANSYLKGVLGYTEEQLVSQDFVGDNRSCICDINATVPVSKCFVKFMAWYDNEFGYACRIVDLANYIASREEC